MKIGIDARMHGSGHGIGRYTSELIPRVIAQSPEHQYVLFVKNKKQQNQLQKDIAALSVEKIFVQFVITNIHWYTVKEQLFFGFFIKKQQVDMMHFLHWNMPFFYSGTFIVTIHDLTMFHFARPEATTLAPFVYKTKDFAHRMLVRRVIKRAKHIITPSQFVAEDIEKTFGNTKEKTVVTHLAPYSSNKNIQNQEQILREYNLKKNQYILYVGAAYPHKNISAAIAAWNVIQKSNPELIKNHEFVLVGKPSVFYKKIMQETQATSSVRYLGFIPDEKLGQIYRGAAVFIFPSLSEGFGIPPLEAMARSIPVVSSTKSCLPEILQDAAIYTTVEDPNMFAQSMTQALYNDSLRQEAKDRGRELVAHYSWEKTAQQTAAVYR